MDAQRLGRQTVSLHDASAVALRTYTEIHPFYPGVGGRLLAARERACDIAGLEVGGEAIEFLDDSTFVLTSEAGRSRPGTIDTVTCGLLREQRPAMISKCWNTVAMLAFAATSAAAQ